VEVRRGVTPEMQLKGGALRGSLDALRERTSLQMGATVRVERKPPIEAAPGMGPVSYRPQDRQFFLFAGGAVGAFGFLGRDRVTLGALDIQLTSGDFAAILATWLAPDHILISTPGYTLGSADGKRQDLTLYPSTTDWYTLAGGTRNATPPVWMQRVESILTLHTNAKQITVYPLDGAGGRMKAIASKAVEGGFEFRLNADSPWYEVVTSGTTVSGLH
jgi:hypothetical protein